MRLGAECTHGSNEERIEEQKHSKPRTPNSKGELRISHFRLLKNANVQTRSKVALLMNGPPFTCFRLRGGLQQANLKTKAQEAKTTSINVLAEYETDV